jgi:hypothetical protein
MKQLKNSELCIISSSHNWSGHSGKRRYPHPCWELNLGYSVTLLIELSHLGGQYIAMKIKNMRCYCLRMRWWCFNYEENKGRQQK